uniref:DUF4485 domain-containing protein n=1 Tax=Culex tarsalis TaxID=7177 RepID=A0A1Q3FTD8_CULTA
MSTKPTLDHKLDEDFLFILNFARSSLHLFKDRPVERSLIDAWFEKLCLELHRGIEAKRIRNLYLVKLVTCIQSGVLQDPFLVFPTRAPLEPLPQAIAAYNLDEPPWLAEFENAAARMTSNVGAKDFSTYQCVRRLDNGKGICAYVAVSVADEGEIPEWVEMGSGKPVQLDVSSAFKTYMDAVEEQLDQSGSGEAGEMDAYCDLLLGAIRRELAGAVAQGEDAYLEQLLVDFGEHIADKPLGREMEVYNATEKRACLLGYLEKMLENRQDEKMRYLH